ncbi:MAG TPA: S-methyl-5-thioribose-1-phosphate isomerase [Planctomycetes bacterium]|nr:S-methyl-5-thioribose-1-phosphate isomerase [Planctomycetota bacterium]
MGTVPETLRWIGDEAGHCELIEQTLLPSRLEYLSVEDLETMRDAILRLAVRGAPAIGIAAAYGIVLGLRGLADTAFRDDIDRAFAHARERLASARPTAVNLFAALDRMEERLHRDGDGSPRDVRRSLLQEALAIHEEDRAMCDALGREGAALVEDGDRLLTHCNAGALATGGRGTALAVMYTAHEQGKTISVWVDETRPLLQGARLTAWELGRAGVPATLICDGAAASLMAAGRVDRVFTGADRIARNGDAANKIGTYGVAALAKVHGIPFYVVAPSTTFDLSLASGDLIPIEERPSDEVTQILGRPAAPKGQAAYNPAFDVTPASLITGLVTEKGVVTPVTEEGILQLLSRE